MKTVIIWIDAPEAKALAEEVRAKRHRAQIRNPTKFRADEFEHADTVILAEAGQFPTIEEAYTSAGAEIVFTTGSEPTKPSPKPSTKSPKTPKSPDAPGPSPEGQGRDAAPGGASSAEDAGAASSIPVNETASRFDAMSDEELRAWVNEAGKESGIVARANASRDKLLQQARLLDAAEA